eukprot:evm.model.NODE_18335_length_53189_cov_28.322943.5
MAAAAAATIAALVVFVSKAGRNIVVRRVGLKQLQRLIGKAEESGKVRSTGHYIGGMEGWSVRNRNDNFLLINPPPESGGRISSKHADILLPFLLPSFLQQRLKHRPEHSLKVSSGDCRYPSLLLLSLQGLQQAETRCGGGFSDIFHAVVQTFGGPLQEDEGPKENLRRGEGDEIFKADEPAVADFPRDGGGGGGVGDCYFTCFLSPRYR